MGLQEKKMGQRTQIPGPPIRSLSQHTLIRASKMPVEGFRKLVTTYRDTIRSNRIEMDKLISSSREKHALKALDPRFRRERTRSPQKPAQSRSESRFTEAHEQPDTHSSPTFTGNQIPRVAKEVELKMKSVDVQTVEAELLVMQEKTMQPEEENRLELGFASCSLENQVNSLRSSLLSDDMLCSELNSVQSNDNESASIRTKVKRRRNSWGGSNKSVVKFNYVNKSPCWEDLRQLKRYTKLLSGTKRSNSSMMSPYALPKLQDGLCTCTKCSHVRHCRREYNYDKYTDMEGSKSFSVEPEAPLKERFDGSYYMTVCYIVGSMCGLLLVGLLAWVLCNDVLWSLVHQREPIKKPTYLFRALKYIGGAFLFTINLVFGSIYNVFVLPRNAVFKRVEEPWSLWHYLE